MKTKLQKLISLLLCAVLLSGAALPVFAAGQNEIEPTWQNTIASVTPVGDGPEVKSMLWYDGYKITQCKLPPQYEIVFKDGTKTTARIPDTPSHFAPGMVYENFFDVETPEGTLTLYAAVMFAGVDTTETVFSVGQYILDGSLGDDGLPVAGSRVCEFPIFEESCEPEVDKGNLFVRFVHFFYSLYLKAERWFVSHFGRK